MHKEKEVKKKEKKKNKVWPIAIVLFFAGAMISGVIVHKINSLEAVGKAVKADTTLMVDALDSASDLVTAKLHITGYTEYEDGGIKWVNKSSFKMVYEATIEAGIDVSAVEITSDDINKKIYISIPEPKIRNAHVNPSTIKYFDEKFAIINWDEKEDANRAQTEAQKQAVKEAKRTGILELAKKQSEALIKGIIEFAKPEGYELIVENSEGTEEK